MVLTCHHPDRYALTQSNASCMYASSAASQYVCRTRVALRTAGASPRAPASRITTSSSRPRPGSPERHAKISAVTNSGSTSSSDQDLEFSNNIWQPVPPTLAIGRKRKVALLLGCAMLEVAATGTVMGDIVAAKFRKTVLAHSQINAMFSEVQLLCSSTVMAACMLAVWSQRNCIGHLQDNPAHLQHYDRLFQLSLLGLDSLTAKYSTADIWSGTCTPDLEHYSAIPILASTIICCLHTLDSCHVVASFQNYPVESNA